jgi:hypothetical protein
MPANRELLVLHHVHVKACGQALYCSDTELRLTDDGDHVVLSHYVELYRADEAGWRSVDHHRVPLSSLLGWLMEHGERVDDGS